MMRELVVFLAVTSVALAGLSISPLEPKPDKFKNKQGCYIKELDDVLPVGASAPCPHHCMEFRCADNYVQIVTCSPMAANGCEIKEDHSKPYPDCCPKVKKCPKK